MAIQICGLEYIIVNVHESLLSFLGGSGAATGLCGHAAVGSSTGQGHANEERKTRHSLDRGIGRRLHRDSGSRPARTGRHQGSHPAENPADRETDWIHAQSGGAGPVRGPDQHSDRRLHAPRNPFFLRRAVERSSGRGPARGPVRDPVPQSSGAGAGRRRHRCCFPSWCKAESMESF